MEEANREPENSIAFGRETLEAEAEAIRRVASRLGSGFTCSLEWLNCCKGKVVTTGVGKSGIAARKLAATLTSTGCPAVFLHPSEAMHGDLGIVASEDVVIALSNGGESEELLAILPALLARRTPIIAIVGNLKSTLAQKATVILDATIEREACPLNLAPTASVIVAIALGDALAMTLQQMRGFGPEDYARNHPGGRLGRRLTLRVSDVMPGGPDALPRVRSDANFMDVLREISAKSLGAVCVTDSEGRLLGLITDNDTRRALQRQGGEALTLTAENIMTKNPALTLRPDQLAYEALRLMEDRPRPLSVAPVVDKADFCLGVIRVHDLIRAGIS